MSGADDAAGVRVSFDSRPETHDHIAKVAKNIDRAVIQLFARADSHDASKLVEPELSGWDSCVGKLATLEYGTEEYADALVELAPTLEHHYAANDHHPDHYPNDDVSGMSALALIEMVCDWKAASERTKQVEGVSFLDNLGVNQVRFGYSDDVARIILNTARELGFV